MLDINVHSVNQNAKILQSTLDICCIHRINEGKVLLYFLVVCHTIGLGLQDYTPKIYFKVHFFLL